MNTRVRASAATNASCPRYASRNTYLPYIMHGCDRFDLCGSSACDEVACVKTALGFNKKNRTPSK